jgi:hypothetical protein
VDVTGAVAAMRSAFRGVLGFTPSARLRSDVYRDVKLLETLRSSKLTLSGDLVEGLIDLQVSQLARRRQRALTRSRPWSTLIIGLIFVGLLAIPEWILYRPGGWLSWFGFVAIAR